MTVWVTGADGQVGRSLRAAVTLEEAPSYLFLTRHDLDITDDGAIQRLVSRVPPSFIVNLAAYTRVDQAESEPNEAMQVNGYAVKLLAQAADRSEVPLIHISTDYVFDGSKTEPYCETDVTNPMNVYGRTKLAGERYIRSLCSRYVIVRTSWVFSEFESNFLTTMLRLGKERETISVVSDQVGGPTYAGDIACLIKQLIPLLQSQRFPSGVLHFCGSPFVSWATFASEIFDCAARLGILARVPTVKPIESAKYPTAAMRPKNSRLLSSRCLQESRLPTCCKWRSRMELCCIDTNRRGVEPL